MKRVLIGLCLVVGILSLTEFVIPGHFSLLMQYFTGIVDLFTKTWGTPTLPS